MPKFIVKSPSLAKCRSRYSRTRCRNANKKTLLKSQKRRKSWRHLHWLRFQKAPFQFNTTRQLKTNCRSVRDFFWLWNGRKRFCQSTNLIRSCKLLWQFDCRGFFFLSNSSFFRFLSFSFFTLTTFHFSKFCIKRFLIFAILLFSQSLGFVAKESTIKPKVPGHIRSQLTAVQLPCDFFEWLCCAIAS